MFTPFYIYIGYCLSYIFWMIRESDGFIFFENGEIDK